VIEQAHVSTSAQKGASESSMPARRHASQILAVEMVGFLAIIALSWANELYGLPSLIFGGGHRVNWPESLLETAIITLVAVPVLLLTRRLVLRLHYLEEFLRVCSWCRKLNAGDEWIPVEEFFAQRFDTQTSHGMCRRAWRSRRRSYDGRAEHPPGSAGTETSTPAEEDHLMNGPRIGIFGVFVIISTLAACSTDQMMVFRKPGITVRQQKADEVACIETSIGAVQEPRPSPLPPIDREAFQQCMRAKGYVAEPK
jgi:hypothetical protein